MQFYVLINSRRSYIKKRTCNSQLRLIGKSAGLKNNPWKTNGRRFETGKTKTWRKYIEELFVDQRFLAKKIALKISTKVILALNSSKRTGADKILLKLLKLLRENFL